MFDGWDTKPDGYITKQEIFENGGNFEDWQYILTHIDTDNDERMSKDELRAYFLSYFNNATMVAARRSYSDKQAWAVVDEVMRRGDLNGDGYITADEVLATGGN